MKKLKQLWKDAGFANIGLAISAAIFLVLWIILGWGELGKIGFLCSLSACIALNWQAIMQKTTIDEDIKKLIKQTADEAKKAYEEKLIEIKKLLIGLKDEK